MMIKKDLYLFVHINKTGGTSIRNILEQKFASNFYHLRILNYSSNILYRIKTYFRIKKATILLGHFNYTFQKKICKNLKDVNIKKIIVFREPLEQQISRYHALNRRLSKGLKITDYDKENIQFSNNINSFIENANSGILDFLPSNIDKFNYVEIIEKEFDLIGTTDNLQLFLTDLLEMFDKKSETVPHSLESKNKIRPNKESIIKFKKKNELEYYIYNYVKNKR